MAKESWREGLLIIPTQARQQTMDTYDAKIENIKIEAGVPIPNKGGRGRTQSEMRIVLETLSIGECATIPVRYNTDIPKMARKVNSTKYIAKQATGRTFTQRSIIAEVDGKLIPAVRVWRMS